MDKATFSVLIYRLARAVRAELDKQTLAVYYEKLGDYPEVKLAWAIDRAMDTERRFPPVSVLLELVKLASMPGLLKPPEKKLLPEEITPPDEAKRRLQEIFDGLNRKFETKLQVEGVTDG
jgi:hypothetical protein